MRRSVYCTASFSGCSRRRTKMPIIYPGLRLDYKVATHPVKGQSHTNDLPESLFRRFYASSFNQNAREGCACALGNAFDRRGVSEQRIPTPERYVHAPAPAVYPIEAPGCCSSFGMPFA